MSMKNKPTTLSFTYTMWGCSINEDQITNSISKMKKIIKDDIIHCLMWGYKKRGEYESPLSLSVPFCALMTVTKGMKIKIDFDKNCKFKCEKFSKILKSRTEHGEVTMDGLAKITVVWKD